MELRKYQVEDLAFHMRTPRSLNLSDPGTGKTPPACLWTWWHWVDNQIKTVWIQPKSLLQKNREELLQWSEFSEDDVVIVDGTAKKRQTLMASPAKVFLMGFDGFSREWEDLLQSHPDIDAAVIDEVHMGYGGHTSKRTQSFYKAMKHITYLLGMTGTIINGRLSSAWPMIQVIDQQKQHYHSYETFMAIHAIYDTYGNVVNWINHETLKPFFRRFSTRHTVSEVYGEQEKVILRETVQMAPKQREAYDEFHEQAILELEQSWLDGTVPVTNLIRSRQLMEHPQEFGPPLDKIGLTGKEERLVLHMQAGKPMIIFSSLVPQQRRILRLAEDLGVKADLINGSVSSKDRNRINDAFIAGELQIVIASPATAAVGYNWGHVDTIVFASCDYMDSSFVQGYRRALRGKRSRPSMIYVLEYERSVDQKIFEIITKKSDMAYQVDSTKEVLELKA